MRDTPVHTHDGKLCYVEDCVLDRDRPAKLAPEPINLESQESFPGWASVDYGYRPRSTGRNPMSGVGHQRMGEVGVPLRIVRVPGGFVLRCVKVYGPHLLCCSEEWNLMGISPAEFTEAIMHACGTDHR